MDALKDILKNKPSIQIVYFNEAGEWLFHPREGFTRKMDRDEVLKSKTATEGDDKPATTVEEAGTAKQATDALLKNTEDAENLELEKGIFEEAKAKFEQERIEFEAAKEARAEIDAAFAQAKSDLAKAKSDLEGATAAAYGYEAEVKTLKKQIEKLEKAKNKKDEDDITA